MKRESSRRPPGRRLLVPLAAGALLLGVYLLRVPLLVGVARVVVVEDSLRPAALIFLLNGDGGASVRAAHAASLYRRGLAPRVAIARTEDSRAAQMGLYPNETDVNVAALGRYGVPESAIVVIRTPGGVASTTDEAVALRGYLARNPAARVILVTSDYHTARARWNLRRALEGVPTEVLVSGARDPEVGPHNWWRSETGMIVYFAEYLKFVHNWLFRGNQATGGGAPEGVRPLPERSPGTVPLLHPVHHPPDEPTEEQE